MSLVEQRLQRLEKRLRVYQYGFLVIILLGGFFMVTAFKKPGAADIIKAKEFQVVDDYGRVLMSLREDSDAGQLDMYNSSGTRLLTFTTSDGGAGTIIGRDASGKKIYRMINVKGGGGSMCVYNTNEAIASEISITDRNTGYMEINNTNGNNMLVCTYGTNSSSGIFSVYNDINTRICVLGSDATGNGVLNVLNRSGGGMNGVWPK
ncbi:MAG TPA: hypothetical protein VEB63_09675 [Chitinophagaceae bacterium]|nr:hypothetical protein [Chitinophagaceae bacterium]